MIVVELIRAVLANSVVFLETDKLAGQTVHSLEDLIVEGVNVERGWSKTTGR